MFFNANVRMFNVHSYHLYGNNAIMLIFTSTEALSDNCLYPYPLTLPKRYLKHNMFCWKNFITVDCHSQTILYVPCNPPLTLTLIWCFDLMFNQAYFVLGKLTCLKIKLKAFCTIFFLSLFCILFAYLLFQKAL